MKISYAPKFVRQYKKLTWEMQELVAKRENIFRKDPFDPRLKTHKLSGALDGFYAFSITYSHRVIFKFIDPVNIHFHQVGDHDIYE